MQIEKQFLRQKMSLMVLEQQNRLQCAYHERVLVIFERVSTVQRRLSCLHLEEPHEILDCQQLYRELVNAHR